MRADSRGTRNATVLHGQHQPVGVFGADDRFPLAGQSLGGVNRTPALMTGGDHGVPIRAPHRAGNIVGQRGNIAGGRIEHRREPSERPVDSREFADLRDELVGADFGPANRAGLHASPANEPCSPTSDSAGVTSHRGGHLAENHVYDLRCGAPLGHTYLHGRRQMVLRIVARKAQP